MSKTFDITSKSDMKKFKDHLHNAVVEEATAAVNAMNFDINCPDCDAAISVPVGRSSCPNCNQEIDLNLDINL